jgi:hypothetical protein
MSGNGRCPQGVENENRIDALTKDIERFETKFSAVFAKLDEIKDLIVKRPSWSVVTLIVGLSTLCASLITGVVVHSLQ